METFIKSLFFGQRKVGEGSSSRRKIDNTEEKNIYLATPQDFPPRNALTIIAGRNRTGKSHLLRNAESAISAHNESLGSPSYERELGASSSNVWVRPVDPDLPFVKSFNVRDIPALVASFSTLGAASNNTLRNSYEREINAVKNDFLKHQFLKSSAIQGCIGGLSREEIDEAWKTDEKRNDLFKKLNEEIIYKVDSKECIAVRSFENLTGAQLYLRPNLKMKGMELVLRFGPEEAYAFGGPRGGWSQGQKVVCALYLLIIYAKPGIILIDELENHLHPEYISRVCEFIKSNVRQSVIVTHHPHLIFSSHVDKAWFFEVSTSSIEPPLMESFPTKRTFDRPAPKRRIIEINNDFERIAATYNLFDSHDIQLMNLATSCQAQMSREILSAIETGMTLQVAGPSTSNRADTQSRELHDALLKVFNGRPDGKVRILDYGAGKGRTFFEMQKTNLFNEANIEWCFFEPNEKTAQELRKKIDAWPSAGEGENIRVIESLTDEPDGLFDAILAVNLLHECTPNQISEILDTCSRLLRQDAKLLIAELYPLLTPERFGIGYAPDDMVEILNCCKFVGFTVPIPMRSGLFSAYTCIASPLKIKNFPLDGASEIRKNVWDRIHRRTLIEYVGGMEMGSSRNAIKLASGLHVLASIAAYDANLWG